MHRARKRNEHVFLKTKLNGNNSSACLDVRLDLSDGFVHLSI